MKHVFVIHSPITYLAALGVICKENIDINDVIIVSEGYCRKEPIPVVVLPIMSRRNPFIYMFPLWYVDHHINKLTNNEKFVAYIPAMYSLAKIISTNLKCRSFHFIEEGLSVYVQQIPLKSYYHTKPALGFRNRKCIDIFISILHVFQGYNEIIDSLPFAYNAYIHVENIKFYGFTKESFVGTEPIIMNFKDVRKCFFANQRVHLKENSVLFVGTYFRGNYNLDNYIKAIDNHFVSYLHKKKIHHIQIKFHPAGERVFRKRVLDLCDRNKISYDLLEDDVVLEIELQYVSNIQLVGVNSSILYYASLWGHKSFSIIKYLPDFPKNNIPVFDSVVNILDS